MNIKILNTVSFVCVLAGQLLFAAAVQSAPAYETGVHRNLFVEMGIAASEQAAKNKLETAYQQLFYGNAQNEKIYFEVDSDMAYILAVDSNDIRSEGMSYGMIIALMMDDQVVFDKLWKFSKNKMQHQSGDRKGYFSWQLSAQQPFNAIDRNPAPDGEEYFVMALMFAANRWGSRDGLFNYSAEANIILNEMVNKVPNVTQVPMMNPTYNQIVFTTDNRSEAFTDPSYHLPAFYELWSRWANRDKAYWQTVAETSRDFFDVAAHPVTGLYSDYANFDGSPKVTTFNPNSHLSAFDAMRTIQNVAVDYAWFERDSRAVGLANRILSFYHSQGDYVTVYTHDGIPQVTYRSEAQIAMNAVAALASDLPLAKDFVEDLWRLPVPAGQWRYYNGLLYLLGFLHTSGQFKIYGPDAGSGLPRAIPQSVSTEQNKQVAITLEGIDSGGRIESYTISTRPSIGTATLQNSTAAYTPALDFVGSDMFSYFVTDNDGNQSESALVSITVKGPSKLTCNIGNADIWNTGFVLNNIIVRNDGAKTVTGWEVKIPVSASAQVTNYWNADVTIVNSHIIASGSQTLAEGQQVSFGLQGSHGGDFSAPACMAGKPAI